MVFEIIGRFPERFINLSTRHGRFVFSSRPYADSFVASLLLCDYRSIRPIARKASVRLRVKERHGLPFVLYKYKSRRGLFVGIILFMIIIILMQSFVWTIEVNGVVTISESALRDAMRKEGLYCGALKKSTDLSALQRDVMKDIKEIGWMSVNIIGTKAEVEIKEKELKPHIVEADTPCNIKAQRDGVILRMNTKYGTAVMSPGSAVIKGSLLVSGVLENPSGDVSFVHADAQVIAQTQRAHTFILDKSGVYMSPDESIKRYKFNAFWLTLPLTFESVSGEYTSRFETKSCFLNNTSMPLGIITEHCTTYKETPYSVNTSDAKRILTADDYLYRLFTLADCETVNAEMHYSENDTQVQLNMLYECTEDIAVAENFIVN